MATLSEVGRVAMLDFHSHILPGIDDGSRSVEESRALLDALARQGVSQVIATPHFYADEQSVERFLSRRQAAFQRLIASERTESLPIRLGAEVRYYPGISRLDGLEKLCVEGTSVLLLEMPMSKWTHSVVQEVLEIANLYDITVVLAHVERYALLQRPEVLYGLRNAGVLFQTNASFFADWKTRIYAFRLMKRYGVHLLGSDCHNLHKRPPRMGEATRLIGKKYGSEYLEQLCAFAFDLVAVFENNNKIS